MGRPKKEKPNHGNYYEVKATVHDASGRKIRKSFYSETSKDDAREKAKQYDVEHQVAAITGEQIIERNISFESWAKKWLETYKKGKVKEHTYNYTYRINVEKYMIPFFANKTVNEITQADIQNYFNSSNIKALADNNLKRHRTILKNIFEKAVYNDLCRKNPVTDINYSSDKTVERRKAYTQAQSDKLIEYSKTHKGGAMIVVMLNTGVRRSELLGLQWEDIDFSNSTVCVHRAITPDTAEPVEGDVKSETSYRTIPVSKDFLEFLKSLPHASQYIIPGKTKYGYLSIDGFEGRYKRFMAKACNELGIPYLVPHELRHTFGTVLREKEVDIYTISKVMGHSDISITSKIYVHNDLDVLKKAMKLDEKSGTGVVQVSYGRKFKLKRARKKPLEQLK